MKLLHITLFLILTTFVTSDMTRCLECHNLLFENEVELFSNGNFSTSLSVLDNAILENALYILQTTHIPFELICQTLGECTSEFLV